MHADPPETKHQCSQQITGTSRYKEMEKHTGIKSEKWQNVAAKKQRVTEEMLEEIGRKWPQYAYWLMTGKTDEDKGRHIDPGYDARFERFVRYSTADQIILTKDRVTKKVNAHPIQHSLVLDMKAGPVEFDWGLINPGAIELAANILHYCGLAEQGAVALAKSFAQDFLSRERGDVTMFSDEEVKDWIRERTQ